MSAHDRLQLLSLPDWGGSGPAHWLSRWSARCGARCVAQSDWQRPLRGDWMMQLEEAVLALPTDRQALLVADGLGAHLVAAWAAHSRQTARVAGAVLIAPPDLDRDPLPPQLHSWRPVPRRRLPFPSLLLAAPDDARSDAVPRPLAGARALADAWGTRIRQAHPSHPAPTDAERAAAADSLRWLDDFAATLPIHA